MSLQDHLDLSFFIFFSHLCFFLLSLFYKSPTPLPWEQPWREKKFHQTTVSGRNKMSDIFHCQSDGEMRGNECLKVVGFVLFFVSPLPLQLPIIPWKRHTCLTRPPSSATAHRGANRKMKGVLLEAHHFVASELRSSERRVGSGGWNTLARPLSLLIISGVISYQLSRLSESWTSCLQSGAIDTKVAELTWGL